MKITDYGYSGEGVGHINGKVAFVPYTLKDEEVDIEIVKEAPSFIKAKLKCVAVPCDKRQKAPCPYFSRCGGCNFQHMEYSEELALKKLLLERQFAKLSCNGDIKVVPSEKEYGYRNKIRLFASKAGLGLNEEGSNRVVKIEKCLLIDDEMNKALAQIQNFVLENGLAERLANVIIRRLSGKIYIWFVFKENSDCDFTPLAKVLREEVSIFKSRLGAAPKKVFGQSEIEAREFGLKCAFGVDSFHQVNDVVYDKLYAAVIAKVVGQKVLNAYSGGGVLSGVIAQSGKDVYGVELGKSEHESAERLKKENGLKNLTNIQGDCAEVLPKLGVKFDCLIVDPPRAGCAKEVCHALNQSDVERIIYISCNPATLVRDIKLLDNYTLQEVTLFDMFPRTANFETLTILNKKK